MHKSLVVLAFVLVGCDSGNDNADPPVPTSHKPIITSLTFVPNTVSYMDGGGSVAVSMDITSVDRGADVHTIVVRTPDGATQEIEVPGEQPHNATFTEEFVVTTDRIGRFTIDVWLVDEIGGRSNMSGRWFSVNWDTKGSDWTSRLRGLPTMNDVIWDGDVFIAVGDGGMVLTSADGIDWITRESGTAASLNAIAFDGKDIFAVGENIVMLSTDHGVSWTTKYEPAVSLGVVEVSPTRVVAAGANFDPLLPTVPQVMFSEDRGDTWQDAESVPSNHGVFDELEGLIYRDGLFVGVTGSGVHVSSDGNTWTEILDVSEGSQGLATIVHDGAQFIAAGSGAVVLTSPDAYNWTQTQTPVEDVRYFSAAWNGSTLMLAGGLGPYLCPQFECPVFKGPHGMVSTDGGVTWEVFNIDGSFENGSYDSLGLAWGNGRFVSVGRFIELGEGAIYTVD